MSEAVTETRLDVEKGDRLSGGNDNIGGGRACSTDVSSDAQ